MADLYCQPQLYWDINTNSYATPAYGFCMDGDGLSTGTATVATVSIDLTGVSAASGNTLQIAGATLTAAASNGTNTFAASSGATLVSNLVTTINAATNTVVMSGVLSGWRASQIRDLFRARINPNNSSILDISTTVGSALFNAKTYFSVVSTGFTGASINAQFSGGTSGAWGVLFNYYTIFPSSVATANYGLWCVNGTMAGIRNPGDVVHIRPISYGVPGNNTVRCIMASTIGSVSAPIRHVVDGSAWGDASSTVMTITQGTGGFSSTFSIGQGAVDTYATIEGGIINGDPTQRTLVLMGQVTGGGGISLMGGGSVRMENIDVLHLNQANTAFNTITMGYGGTGELVLKNVRVRHYSVTNGYIVVGGATSNQILRMVGCTLDNGSNTGVVNPNPHPAVIAPGNQYLTTQMILEDCQFTGFCSGSNLCNSSGGDTAGWRAVTYQALFLRNCALNNITNRGPYLINQGSPPNRIVNDHYTILGITTNFKSGTNNRDMLVETYAGLTEWNSQKQQPYLNARLPDNTGWSYRVATAITSTNVNTMHPYEVAPITQINSMADGVRTITLEVLVHSSLAWTKRDLAFKVSAIALDGSTVSVDTWDINGSAFTTSTAAWTNLSGDATDPTSTVSYNDGGIQVYNRYSISVSTGVAIKSGEPIVVTPRVHNYMSNSKYAVFIDPAFKVA